MKFLADENLFEPIIEYLRQQGHDVLSLREFRPGIEDEEVYKIACEQERVIVTMDKDFSNFFRFNPHKCGGIIVVKIYRHSIKEACTIFRKFFELLKHEHIFKNLVIMSPNQIRIKRFEEETE